MSRFRIPVAMVTSVAALFFSASESFADEATQQTTTTTTAPAPVLAPAPAKPQVSTTQTTAAPYVVQSEDRYSERTTEHRPNRTLLSTGTGLFILSYGSSAIAATVSDRDADKRLYIPVVGPWMDLGDRGCGGTTPCGANEDVAKAMVITSGVVQGAGLLMALSSLVIPESTTVTERTRSAKVERKPEVHILPMSLAAGAGIGAIGRF